MQQLLCTGRQRSGHRLHQMGPYWGFNGTHEPSRATNTQPYSPRRKIGREYTGGPGGPLGPPWAHLGPLGAPWGHLGPLGAPKPPTPGGRSSQGRNISHFFCFLITFCTEFGAQGKDQGQGMTSKGAWAHRVICGVEPHSCPEPAQGSFIATFPVCPVLFEPV